MKIAFWVVFGLLLGSVGLNKYQDSQIKELRGTVITIKLQNDQDLKAVRDGFVWDKQQLIQLSHDSIKTAKTWYGHAIDSISKVNNLNVNRLESALMLKSHWIDSLKEVADKGKFIPLNPNDTNKINPLGRVAVSKQLKCWGFKGEIITRDPEAYLEILEKSTNTYTNLIVTKQKKFLFWTIRKAEYHIYNDCGEMSIINVKFQ